MKHKREKIYQFIIDPMQEFFEEAKVVFDSEEGTLFANKDELFKKPEQDKPSSPVTRGGALWSKVRQGRNKLQASGLAPASPTGANVQGGGALDSPGSPGSDGGVLGGLLCTAACVAPRGVLSCAPAAWGTPPGSDGGVPGGLRAVFRAALRAAFTSACWAAS